MAAIAAVLVDPYAPTRRAFWRLVLVCINNVALENTLMVAKVGQLSFRCDLHKVAPHIGREAVPNVMVNKAVYLNLLKTSHLEHYTRHKKLYFLFVLWG